MKVNIPRVTRPVALSDYAPEFGDQAIEMWVNPPRKVRLEFYRITNEAKDGRIQISALSANDKSIAQHTKDSTGHEKEYVRQFADLVLKAYADVKDLTDEEKDERMTSCFKRIGELGEELNGWYAQMWSKGDGEWTAEDVKAFVEAALDTDPGLWDFVQEGCLDAMAAYRRQKKANSPGPPK